jgi:hypothetical protein
MGLVGGANKLSSTPSAIDTKTETVDKQLNQEFYTKLKRILTEEKEAFSPQNKEKATKDILEYVKTCPDNQYIKLPYNLVESAARA